MVLIALLCIALNADADDLPSLLQTENNPQQSPLQSPAQSPAQTNDPTGTPTPGVDEGAGAGFCPADADTGSSCEVDNGAATGSVEPNANASNPINLMTGNKNQSEIDFSIPGAKLNFRRMYSSVSSDANIGLGQGWTHTYAVSLYDAGNGNRQIVQSNGSRLSFTAAGADEQGHPIMRGQRFNHGYVRFKDDRHEWHLPDGRTLTFNGSFLIHINWPDQRELSMFYRHRRLHSVTDETGRVLRFDYTPGGKNGLLNRYEQQRFTDIPAHLASLTLPDGSQIHYDYDNNRNLTRVRFADNTSREYHYENETYPNHLTGLTDRTGVRFASWRYDEHGRAISGEHADGVEKVTLTLPHPKEVASGGVVQTILTNSLGNESLYSWQHPKGELHPRLLSSSGAGCATCAETGFEYQYDVVGRLTERRSTAKGQSKDSSTISYRYDELGRLNAIERQVYSTTAATRTEIVEQREYIDSTQLLRRVVREGINVDDGASINIEYDDNGKPIRLTERGYSPVVPTDVFTQPQHTLDADAFESIERTTHLEWQNNKLIAIDGPRTDVEDITRLQWDERNRLIRIAPPLSPALSIEEFDAMGRAVQIRLGQQRAVSLEYSSQGRLVKSRQGARELNFSYDSEGRLIKIRNSYARSYSMEYDEAGRLVGFVDDIGQRKAMRYDSESQRVSDQLVGIGGEQLTLLSVLFDEQGYVSRTQHEQASNDAHGSRFTVAEHEQADNGKGTANHTKDVNSGGELIRSLDQVNRVASISDGHGIARRIEFDASGRRTRVSDQRGNVTRYWFDDFGRQILSAGADKGVQVSRFDAADNLLERRRGDGTSIRYQYDAANRQTQRFDGTSTSTLIWDEVSGKLAEASNPQTTERFAYDTQSRLIEHERQIDGHRFRTAYQYDELGRLTEKQLPDGQRLSYWYHEEGVNRGSLRAITTGGLFGVGQQTIVAEIDLERRDGTSGYIAGNGVRNDMRYAPDGQIQSIRIGGQLALDYGFDEQGRISHIDENGQRQSYQWQGRRLSVASTLLGNYTYEYDAADNRTARTVDEHTGRRLSERYRYPSPGEGNRLQGVVNDSTAQSTGYDYNGAGAAMRIGDLQYTNDAYQRPVQVHRFDKLVAEYVYNPFGERVKKTVYDEQGVATITYFLFDGSSMSAQADAQGDLIDQYIYVEKYRPVARLADGEIQAIHTDHLGAPRQVTDAQGQVIWQARYSPFGQATIEIETIDLPHRLPGQQLDRETGLHYNYFRHYDPSTGRYTTSDPLGLDAGYNTYGYVGGNPLSAIDPRGLLAAFTPFIGGAGGLISLSRGVFFVDTAGATGALARFVAGVVAAGASPVVAGATVVALGVLAVYYVNHSFIDGESTFTDEMGGAKPEAADFNAIRSEMDRFFPDFSDNFNWEGRDSWEDFFWLHGKLLEEQRRYIARCIDDGKDVDNALYNEAVEKVEAADAAQTVAQGVDTATPPPPPDPCKEHADKIRQLLYGNKHADNSYGPAGGTHGYMNRMLEQMCGKYGPDTDSWVSHNEELKSTTRGIRNNRNEGNRLDSCDVDTELSTFDKRMIELIKSPAQGWGADTLPFYGRDHALCQDFKALRDGGDVPALLRRLATMTGVPF